MVMECIKITDTWVKPGTGILTWDLNSHRGILTQRLACSRKIAKLVVYWMSPGNTEEMELYNLEKIDALGTNQNDWEISGDKTPFYVHKPTGFSTFSRPPGLRHQEMSRAQEGTRLLELMPDPKGLLREVELILNVHHGHFFEIDELRALNGFRATTDFNTMVEHFLNIQLSYR